MVLSLSIGEYPIAFTHILNFWKLDPSLPEYTILMDIRLPRVILAVGTGGALSLAGILMQGIYRNPLVEPYTLGVSGGAALGVSIAIISGLTTAIGSIVLPLSGMMGALLVILILYIFSLNRGKIRINSMLLTGVMISFITSSAIMLLMSLTKAENLHGIIFWTMGSLDEPDNRLIAIVLFSSIGGLLLSMFFIKSLNALRLGEEKAYHLGVDTDYTIRFVFLIASILTGITVAVSGVIGFVGLIIPHLIRKYSGNDYKTLIINCFLGGATFLVLSDILSRILISPNELPIGVITGIIGGVLFIGIISHDNLVKR